MLEPPHIGLVTSVAPSFSRSCMYLLIKPLWYLLMRFTSPPSFSRCENVPTGGRRNALRVGRHVNGGLRREHNGKLDNGREGQETARKFEDKKREVSWLYGSTTFNFRSRKRSGFSTDLSGFGFVAGARSWRRTWRSHRGRRTLRAPTILAPWK
jgi:hypothetical protein